MSHTPQFGISGIALLALLMAVGAPAMTCASMADCAMQTSAAGCHSSTDAQGCDLVRVDAVEDRCCTEATKPLTASSSEAPVPTSAADAPGPAGPRLQAEADQPVPARQRSLCRPAGRALLSLHQTLLI